MKNFHLNTSPAFVTINELTSWGEDHPDPWVRRLAEIVSDLNYILPINNDVESAISKHNSEIDSLYKTIQDLEFDIEVAEKEKTRACEERDSLKFDLDEKQQEWLMSQLKARVLTQDDYISKLQYNFDQKSEYYRNLLQEHEDLKEKYDTWKIIST